MNGKFTHYLITRFNVPVTNWEKDKAGNRVLDQAWLDERFGLFRKYCVPTIANQFQKNFIWLIYCDVNTSPGYLATIRQAVSEIPGATIRLVNDFDHLLKDLRQLLAENPTPFIITSRVDNDDGLGPQFIKEVQMDFKPIDMLIINFTKGVLYDVMHRVLTEIRSSHFNHYGSLVEENNAGHELITIMGYPHGRPPENAKVINIESRFAWLKIIHGRNMSSRTNGMPLSDQAVTSFFNLEKRDLVQSWSATGVFVISRLLSRARRKVFPNKNKSKGNA
jgi:hypothetical protein